MTDRAHRIAVVGAGSWGTALAHTLACDGVREVTLWARRRELAEEIGTTRRNPAYLGDVPLDTRVRVSSEMHEVVVGAPIVIVAVPTHAMRGVAGEVAEHLDEGAVVVSAAKGFETGSDLTMTAVLGSVLGSARAPSITALSGPNIAVEIARGLPAATVVGGAESVAAFVRDSCTGPRLRVYSTSDCIGVEYGGALKNIVAIAAGVSDGIGTGDNGKAAIVTRGLAEMARLGVAAGAHMATFAGLAGIGDCVVTCISPHSRNRGLGEAMGRGATLDEALGRVAGVTEGVNATRVALRIADKLGVDMPITREVHAVLFGGKSVRTALSDLMSRDPAAEAHGLGGGDVLQSTRPGE